MTKMQFTFPGTVQLSDGTRGYLQVYLWELFESKFEVSRRGDYFRTLGRIREQIGAASERRKYVDSTVAA